ncbi:hypothetical protein BH23ACT5_BH23ACT5_13640 [soil metagenome]
MTRSRLSRRRRTLPIVAVIVALSVAACTPPEGGIDEVDVVGHWLLDSGRLLDEPFPLVDGHRITLFLGGDGTLRGRSTCNSYAADYQLVAGIFDLGAELAATTALCDPQVMAAEEALFRALPILERATLGDDRLILDSDDAVLEFTPLAELDPAFLQGEWVITTHGSGGTFTTAKGEPALAFTADEEISGDTGCRTFRGIYVIEGDEVFATELEVDGECIGGPTSQDDDILDLLGSGFVVEDAGDALNLTAQGGRYLSIVRR